MLDNLNIHQSESLVRWVAEREGIATETLGENSQKRDLAVDGKPRRVFA